MNSKFRAKAPEAEAPEAEAPEAETVEAEMVEAEMVEVTPEGNLGVPVSDRTAAEMALGAEIVRRRAEAAAAQKG